jgi:hypothetical protein
METAKQRSGKKTLAKRYETLMSRVIKINEPETASKCWEYQGTLNHGGYAQVGYGGKSWLLHRLVYTKTIGEIPEGLLLMHTCDNRKCCNPEHLKPGTHKENHEDMRNKGRDKIEAQITKPAKKPLKQSAVNTNARAHYYLKKYGRTEAEVKALKS